MLDEKIVELYFLRNESAISETSKKYERYLIKIALNILADAEDAKECVNDAYLAAWNSIPPNEPSVLSAYLRKLVRRIAIDKYRLKSREKRIPSEYTDTLEELDEYICSKETTESEYETKLLADAINSFLKELPEDARNLFIGRYYFNDPFKEVCAYCNIRESKAKNIIFRTKKALKTYLKKEGFDV